VEVGLHNYNTNLLATHQNAFASHVATGRPYSCSPEQRFAHVDSLRAHDMVLKHRNVCTFPFLLGAAEQLTRRRGEGESVSFIRAVLKCCTASRKPCVQCISFLVHFRRVTWNLLQLKETETIVIERYVLFNDANNC
jgi:hypothetical protein